MKTLKIMLCIATFSTSFSLQANTAETPFEDPKKQKTFETAQQNGVFKGMRKNYAENICPTMKKEELPKLNCDCFVQKLEEISDRELFEASLTAYDTFRKKAAILEAEQAGDTARAEEIQKTISNEKSKIELLPEQCLDK